MEMLKEGILGIGETDETENEEGSEIELTAYNPDFDEPQLTDEEKLQIESEEENPRIDLFSSTPLDELTDGVSTLFMKKGGRVPFQGGGRDASQDDFGGGTSGGNTGGGNGGNDRPTMADIAGPTTTTSTTAPDTGGHSRFDVGSGYYGEPTTSTDGDNNYKDPILDMVLTPHQKITKHNEILDKHAHRFKPLKDLTWDQKERWAKDKYEDFKTAKGFMSIASGPFGWLSAGKAVIDANKRKEETINDLKTDIKTLTDLGYPTHHPTVDTLVQSLEQEILDMTQPRSKDEEDTGGDGPEAPAVAPVTEEIEDSYAQATGFLQGYRDLKAKQALSAQLQQKWADERQWQQETLFANSGGLANLFRVKN